MEWVGEVRYKYIATKHARRKKILILSKDEFKQIEKHDIKVNFKRIGGAKEIS